MPEFLTNIIGRSNPTSIGIIIGIVAVVVIVAIASYFWWTWSQKKWPFGQ